MNYFRSNFFIIHYYLITVCVLINYHFLTSYVRISQRHLELKHSEYREVCRAIPIALVITVTVCCCMLRMYVRMCRAIKDVARIKCYRKILMMKMRHYTFTRIQRRPMNLMRLSMKYLVPQA